MLYLKNQINVYEKRILNDSNHSHVEIIIKRTKYELNSYIFIKFLIKTCP